MLFFVLLFVVTVSRPGGIPNNKNGPQNPVLIIKATIASMLVVRESDFSPSRVVESAGHAWDVAYCGFANAESHT